MTEVEVKRKAGNNVDEAAALRAAPTLRSVSDPLQAQQRRARLRAVLVIVGLVLGVTLIGASLYLLVIQTPGSGVPSAGSIPTLPEVGGQASLSFVVEPEDARISVNGGLLADAQTTSHELRPGSYLISIRADGYAGVDSLVRLSPNSAFVFVARLQEAIFAGRETNDVTEEVRQVVSPEPASGGLAVTTNVEGARVMVDGRLIGLTPLSTSLPAGSYRVSLEAEGHRPVTRTVEIVRGADVNVSETLAVQTGFVRVLVLPWGSIYTNGRLQVEDTDIRHSIELPVGQNLIVAQHPVLGRLERTIDVRADESLDVVLDFAP
jgi:hypothetical protein